jgi:hypothetical protein
VAVIHKIERGGQVSREAPPGLPFDSIQQSLIDWNDFWSSERNDPEWAYEDILARGRGHSIYARHKVGKSLLALFLAVEMVKAGTAVLYLDFEQGEDDLHERLSDMGYGPEADLSRLLYALFPTIAPLDTEPGGTALAAMLDRVLETIGAPLAVVIDTFSRVTSGEENSNDTVQAFHRYSGVELKRRGVTWLRLDHAGWDSKNSGARGASGKGDDVDVVWELVPTDDGLELVRKAARMGWVPERVPLRKLIEPLLAFEAAPRSWPQGTHEAAALLDELGLDLEVTGRAAQQALKDADRGRRAEVVRAAVKYRRESRDAPPGPTPLGIVRTPLGTQPPNADGYGQDAPPDPPGLTPIAHGSRSGVPPWDPVGPGPIGTSIDRDPDALASPKL